MKLKIRDLEFDIESAEISGQLNDPYWIEKYNPTERLALVWMLSIDCKEKEVKDSIWQPSIYHEDLRFDINNWKDIQDQTIKWDASLEDDEACEGGFYVFEHGDMNKGEIRTGRLENDKLNIYWKGDCNIYFDDEYYEDVPFELSCKASIGNLCINGSEHDGIEEIETRLKKFISLDNLKRTSFEVSDHQYESGVKMAKAVYSLVD